MNKTSDTFGAASRRLLGQLLLALYVLAGNGCRSTDKPGSAGFASVVISGNTPGQISDAAIDVFRENGYKVAQTDPSRLYFEKQGSRMNNFAYGNWVGDTPVWIRVKAGIVPMADVTFRLRCSAYMVRDIGGSTEEEIALSKFQRGPYQKILDEVAKRLAQK